MAGEIPLTTWKTAGFRALLDDDSLASTPVPASAPAYPMLYEISSVNLSKMLPADDCLKELKHASTGQISTSTAFRVGKKGRHNGRGRVGGGQESRHLKWWSDMTF